MNRSSSVTETLSRLTALQADGHRVLSLYLNFDPTQFPNLRERHMQADALLDDAARRDPDGPSSHADRIALREDIAALKAFLTDEELAVQPARGLAIFRSTPTNLFEVLALARPVEPAAVVEQRPYLEPLLELAAPERWCVLLASRRAGRILYGTREHLREATHVLDDVHRRHAQGGWSQPRYQRGVEHEVDEHLRELCGKMHEQFQQAPFERLLIGGPSELHHRVEGKLHEDLRRCLAGNFEIDVERATPDEAHRRALPLIEADEARREQDALAHVREGLAPNGHAATGLDEVLESLNERRVQTLLLAPGYAAAGFACPQCGRLDYRETPCPLDGTAPQPRADMVEDAISLALGQSAEVLVVRHQPGALAELGEIAALVRF